MPVTKKGGKKFTLLLNEKWCKGCGICVLLCPQGVLRLRQGKAFVYEAGACVGCKTCELHCPDFAIRVGGEDDERQQ